MEAKRIKTISEFHTLRGLPQPQHPLISIIDYSDMKKKPQQGGESWIFSFYCLSVKREMNHKYRYGQQTYDFDKGILFFLAPHQLLRIQREEDSLEPKGWMLMIHPDFFWNTSLAKKITTYDFFDYSVNEALFLSEEEETIIHQLIDTMRQEMAHRIDKFSQDIILSQVATLLSYSDRFYQRQFITRDKVNHQLLERLEQVVNDYLKEENLANQGLPTVHYIADQLHVSPGYLRSLLKFLTGQTTQQYIHLKLIDKAKEKLSTTDQTISEIAYELGFEHSQSFSKFFKKMTDSSPGAFRQLFL